MRSSTVIAPCFCHYMKSTLTSSHQASCLSSRQMIDQLISTARIHHNLPFFLHVVEIAADTSHVCQELDLLLYFGDKYNEIMRRRIILLCTHSYTCKPHQCSHQLQLTTIYNCCNHSSCGWRPEHTL